MRFLLLFCLLVTVSCSTSTRRLFFDIPAPSAEQLAQEARKEATREAELTAANNQVGDKKDSLSGATDDNQPRPAIESLLNWEQVLETLPKDYKKKADWAAAIEQGLVRPRTGADPRAKLAASFKYDFIIGAEKPKNEASKLPVNI